MPKYSNKPLPGQLSFSDFLRRCNYIYVLIDPRDNLPFYVGRTLDPESRLVQHISKARGFLNEPSGHWEIHWPNVKRIAEILKAGYEPSMKVVEIVPYEYKGLFETRWKKYYLSLGYELTNNK